MAPSDDGMVELSMESLAEGKVLAAVNEELGRVVADVAGRPGLAKARVVKLEISLTPKAAEGLTIVGVDFATSVKLPTKNAGSTVGVLARDGKSVRVSGVEPVQSEIEGLANVTPIGGLGNK